MGLHRRARDGEGEMTGASERWVSEQLDRIGVSLSDPPGHEDNAQRHQAYSLWVISRCCYVGLKMVWYFLRRDK